MSNIKDLLYKRRSKFYEGETLRDMCDSFLQMIEKDGVVIHDFDDTIIVLEPYGLPGYFRGWLLFDHFSKKTATCIKKVTDEFTGRILYAATHDPRIKTLLQKFGYVEYAKDENDFYLKKVNYGM